MIAVPACTEEYAKAAHLFSAADSSRAALLDALVRAAIEENERAVAQALRGERDPHTGAQWETCFRFAFERVFAALGSSAANPPGWTAEEWIGGQRALRIALNKSEGGFVSRETINKILRDVTAPGR